MKRTRTYAGLVVFFCAQTVAAFAADKIDVPPSGLGPASVTISQILKQHDASTGALEGSQTSRIEQWSINDWGLAGTETVKRSGSDYSVKIVSGPLVEESGFFQGHGWSRDYNGVVSPASEESYTTFGMLAAMPLLNDASDPKNDVSVAGQNDTSYVVKVTRSGEKHPEWVYFSKATGLVSEISFVSEDERFTITFDDYRTTKGLSEPWHIHMTGDDKTLNNDYRRTSLDTGAQVTLEDLLPPASSTSFAKYSGNITLPGKMVWAYILQGLSDDRYMEEKSLNPVIRVIINGRGLDFAISSDAPTSLIDWDVAQQLGLPTYGQVTHDNSRNPVAFDTVVPQAQIGPMTLTNFAVRAIPFNYEISSDTKVVGLISYDILSTGVFKLDFVKGAVSVMPASRFDSNDPLPGAAILSLTFDRGHPFFHGEIDSHVTDNIILDNDFDYSFLLGSFTQAHPESAKDTSNGKQHKTAIVPFADSRSFGQQVEVWQGTVPSFKIGPANFVNHRMLASNEPHQYGDHDVDAVVGTDFLQWFDVYFDFPHSRVFLVPNANFSKAFKAAGQ